MCGARVNAVEDIVREGSRSVPEPHDKDAPPDLREPEVGGVENAGEDAIGGTSVEGPAEPLQDLAEVPAILFAYEAGDIFKDEDLGLQRADKFVNPGEQVTRVEGPLTSATDGPRLTRRTAR
jgi:hypothetical protein